MGASSSTTVVLPEHPDEVDKLGLKELQSILRELRIHPLRRSVLVHNCGVALLKKYSNRMGDEKWLIYEQLLVAALDCGAFDMADTCYTALHAKFPDSTRVRRAGAMVQEAYGNWNDATEIYNSILKESPCDKVSMRRKIAISKSNGQPDVALTQLNEYLNFYQADEDANHEAAILHLAEQKYARAAFYFEELLLLDPRNHHYLCRYAETLYTTGGLENIKLARKYFSEAIRLNGKEIAVQRRNLRPFYGVWLCCLALQERNTTDELSDMIGWIISKMIALYTPTPSDPSSSSATITFLQPLITTMLASKTVQARQW